MTKERSRFLSFVLISFFLVVYTFQNYIPESLSQINWKLSQPNRSLTSEDDGPSPQFERYAYVIVTYHKAGHELSHTLRGLLKNHMQAFGASLKDNNISPRTNFNAVTKCSVVSLEPGTVTVIEAPEFHCDTNQLDNLLMNNPDSAHSKWGIKVIHLVRNPFSMAVSNYHFHSQDPTPEPFVHWANPCSLTEKQIGPLADLVAPTLSRPMIRIPMNGELFPADMPIMTRQDFDNIANDCNYLFQTKAGLVNATYYEHLRALDPTEGLRMATADKFSHFALMTNDLIMFDRVRQLEQERSASASEPPRQRHREFDLITMPMEEWIDHPYESMYKFLVFIFHDHMPHRKKKALSERYEHAFAKKSRESSHFTSAKSADTARLIEYLRKDEVFGGPLARIESLLVEILRRERLLVEVS